MPAYPDRVIQMGEDDPKVVKQIKKQLNLRLFPNDEESRLDLAKPAFDAATKRAVQLFQMRNTDAQGQPLVVDGKVGPITWAELFETDPVPILLPKAGLLTEVLRVARLEIGVREEPRNSNLGPRVEEYQALTGTRGKAWCVSFVYWCFNEAAKNVGVPNPMFKTAGVLKHWEECTKVGGKRLTASDAAANPKSIKPGMIFVVDYGKGLGHSGLVEAVDGAFLKTLEGNTDASGKDREGGGVYEVTRKLNSVNTGFVLY